MTQKTSRKNSKGAAKIKKPSWLAKLFGGRYSKPVAFAVAFMIVGGGLLYFVSAATTSYSLWSNSAVPKVISTSGSNGTVLGLKFKSTVAGYITGVRFYKGAQNTGIHTGNLWDSDGKLLASVQFTKETSNGWQTASFNEPVSIAANVTYVVSYYAPKGHYSLNANYFKTSAHSRKNLVAPASTTASPNGVFVASSNPNTFPTTGGNGANYWVDVVFNAKLISPSPAPAAPAGLTATVQTNNSVVLNWQASASANPIAGYSVYRDGSKLGTSGTALTYTDTTTEAGKTYNYQVQATDSTGQNSALTAAIAVVIPPADGGTPPPPPPPTASCTGTANHVPDGADGTGTCWPGPNTTGVPAGTTLTAYTGSCSITTVNLTIDSKTINCPGDLVIRAANVTITRSKITGHVVIDTDVDRTWSLTLTDSEVAATDGDLPAIYNGNVNIVRANIHGGHNGLECQEHSSHCSLKDSWVHDQWQSPTGDTHLGGIAHFGEQVPCTGTASNGMTAVCFDIEHNSIICDAAVNASGGGCTGDLNMIAHYGPIPGAFIYKNLLGANIGASYCSYGGQAPENGATRIVYQDNVFQRGSNRICGAYGPVTGFKFSNTGNVWVNNKYADGATIVCTAADECL